MTLINEKIEHINYGLGTVTEERDHKIWVQFEEEIGVKAFLYPEAFEKFLKAADPAVENNVLEELHRKLEQIELERQEKEREAAELKEKMEKFQPVKRKKSVRVTNKKAI